MSPTHELRDKILFYHISDNGQLKSQEWWLVGLFGPMIGAGLGAFIYIFLVGAQLNEEFDEEQSFPQKRITPNSGDAEIPEWRANRFLTKPQAPQPPRQGGSPTMPYGANIQSPYGIPPATPQRPG